MEPLPLLPTTVIGSYATPGWLWTAMEEIKQGKYGVRATTRFGIGILRSNAIAKMTNIATTLA